MITIPISISRILFLALMCHCAVIAAFPPSSYIFVNAQSSSSSTYDYISVLADTSICSSVIDFVVDDARTTAWVACDSADTGPLTLGGKILAVDLRLGNATTLVNQSACETAYGVTRHPITGVVYAACQTGVIGIDPQGSLSFLNQSALCPLPFAVEVSPDGRTVIAVCSTGVIGIDIASNSASFLMSTSQCNQGHDLIVYSENSVDYVVVVCATSGIIRRNLNTGEVSTLVSLNVCSYPTGISRNTQGSLVATCQYSGAFRLEPGRNATQIATQSQCPFASSSFHDERFNLIFLACNSGDVLFVTADGSTGSLVPFSRCNGPLKIVSDINRATIIGCGNTGLIRVSSSTMSTAASFLQCQNPQNLALVTYEGQPLLAASCDNSITLIAGNSVKVLTNNLQCIDANVIYQRPDNGLILASCQGAVIWSQLVSINASTSAVTSLLDHKSLCNQVGGMLEVSTSSILYLTCLGWGFAKYDFKTGNLTLLMPQCVLGSAIDWNAATGALYAACKQAGVLSLSSNGIVTTIADSSVCAIATSVALVGDLLFAGCGRQRNPLVAVNVTNGRILTVVTSDVCSQVSFTHNPGSSTLSISCPEGVFTVDTNTFAITQIFNSYQCASSRQTIQNPISGAIYASCYSQGIFVAAADFKCLPGTTFSLGTCVQCSPGFFRDSGNLQSMGQCQPCPAGSISSQSGSTVCTSCPSGSYASNNLCIVCAAGKYQPNTNATGCIDCDVGTYAILPGSSICSQCDPGFYSSSNGSVSCLPCDRGSASDVVGLTHRCEGCPAGYYQGAIGKTSCIPCEPHTYAEHANSTSCTRCANQVNSDRTSCSIVICPVNSQFNDVSNACELCPLSQYSSRGGLCSTCVVNTYTPGVGSGCAPCDGVTGLECSGGLASVKAGYWAFLDQNVRWYNGTVFTMDQIMQLQAASVLDPNIPAPDPAALFPLYATSTCPSGFCLGSALQVATAADGVNSNQTQAPDYCIHPRLNSPNNTLCAQCELGYLAWGDSCVTCDAVNGGLAVAYLVLSFAFVLFLLASSSSSASTASTSIFLFFVQTAALEMNQIVKFLKWLQIMNFDPRSTTVSCLAPWSGYGQTLFALFIPVILIGEMCIIALIHYIIHKAITGNEDRAVESVDYHRMDSSNSSDDSIAGSSGGRNVTDLFREFSYHRYRVCAISILLFCYTQVATAALRYLHCVQVDSQHLNFSAPTIECQSGEYKSYLVAVLFALILYIIGFPVVAFGLLWSHRHSLYLPADSDVLRSSPQLAAFVHQWAPFYRMYHPRAWFWQCWVLLRRAAFVVTSVLLMQQPSKQFMTFNFLHFASLVLHQYVRPYEDNKLNHMETASYVLLICVSELLLGYNPPPYPTSVQAMLFVLIVPPAVAMFAFIVRQRFNQWKKRGQNNANDRLQNPAKVDSTSIFTEMHRMSDVNVAIPQGSSAAASSSASSLASPVTGQADSHAMSKHDIHDNGDN